ncbi:MAG: hypothetical protein HY063_08360 [Bacteroidetes bacterium]|nr:hypothetical protein [Bacteroidota bacterium]
MKKKFTAVKVKINQKYYLIPQTTLLELVEDISFIKEVVKQIAERGERDNPISESGQSE